MDRGKRKMEEEDPAPNKAEKRQRKARRAFEIVSRQFWPLLEQIDEWLGQHGAPQGQEEPHASDVKDGAPPPQARVADVHLAATIQMILQQLEGNGEASSSGQAADPKPEVPPADPAMPEAVPPADPLPEADPPADPKPDAPLAGPKPEASTP